MSLWKKGFEKSKIGSKDVKAYIEWFFKYQKNVESYEIVDENNWIVNVKGTVELKSGDFSEEKLPFKLGVVTGDLILRCETLSPTVLPTKVEGEIKVDLDLYR